MTRINQINSLILILNAADLKLANTQCSEETPNHEKLRMPSTLISRVKKKILPKNTRECDQGITVAEI